MKVRGGAQALNNVDVTIHEPSFTAKSQVNLEEKQRIAAAALNHIQDGDRLILDSGTTVLELARLLRDRSRLTVVTNDIRIASELSEQPEVSLLLVGGMIRRGYCSSYGFFAEEMLSNITVNKLFFSVDAIDPDLGLMSYTMDDLNLKKIGMSNALERILLCDHSKFSTRALFSVCDLSMIDTIIAGRELNPATAQKLTQMGILTMAAVPDASAKPVTSLHFDTGAVAVIGNEGNGLTKETIEACKVQVTIPMKGRAESLNASMAACILMWEMLR